MNGCAVGGSSHVNNMTQNWTNLTKTLRRKSKSAWSLRIKSGKTSAEGGGSGSTASQLVSALGGALCDKSAGQIPQWTKATVSRAAPHWEGTAVVNGEMKELKLTDYRGKYLVLFFYPLDFTYVCPTEILAFNDLAADFRAAGAEIIACSVDSHFTHHAWMNTPRREGGLGHLEFPLLSDLTHVISKDYGVYLEDNGHTLRGLFIIDERGIVRHITLNDLSVGRSAEETLRLVQAFQYADKHGEVCPAGWKPGRETIVPDPREKLKYFKGQRNQDEEDSNKTRE